MLTHETQEYKERYDRGVGVHDTFDGIQQHAWKAEFIIVVVKAKS